MICRKSIGVKGLVTLLNCAEPVFAIALSRVVNARFCLAFLESGGYAVIGKPLDRQSLVGLVYGALRLEDSIDSCRVFEQVDRKDAGGCGGSDLSYEVMAGCAGKCFA